MSPTLLSGDIVVGLRRSPRAGQIALIRASGREVIKRVKDKSGQKLFIIGDNSDESTDSRHYGHINHSEVVATLFLRLRRVSVRRL